VIARDPPASNVANFKHGKGRGKNAKNMEDKRGKVVENNAIRELPKQNVMKMTTNGTHAATNKQNLQARKKEMLTRRENQGDHELHLSQALPTNQYGIIAQAPHNNQPGVNGAESHVGTNHTPRPPESFKLGQVNNHNIIGPNSQNEATQEHRRNEEDMEITNETPQTDQEEGGAKSMILA
jgi:hypothetical protein